MIKRVEGEAPKEQAEITYLPSDQPRWGERLARNLALAGMLAITIAAMRNAELPTGTTVLTAVQQMIDGEWDDHLGKISFVGRFLPETVAVFFESAPDTELTAPCFGSLTHAWTEQEPYLAYEGEDKRVFAVAAGQVMSVSHGPEEEYILRVRHEDGLETMYYNLASAAALEGDMVTSATCLGEALPGGAVIEVRRAGRAIDPTSIIADRAGSAP
ncbi:MAG: M23 family metallopeptidase [Clostridia bacterium]|nr:M23 family metallopeptidase [Clostridia bacterium]